MQTIYMKKLHKITESKNISEVVNNSISIEDFRSLEPVYMSDSISYTGGLFPSLVDNSTILMEVLITLGVDINNISGSIEALCSSKSSKIQVAIFRNSYLKPLKKWLKNRKIRNKSFALKLMQFKISGDFESISSYLDDRKSYTVTDINRYLLLQQ